MKNKMLVILAVVMMCSSTQTAEVNAYVKQLEDARDNLLRYPDYIISNTYESFYGVATSLSIRHNDIQYIEYPINASEEVEYRDFLSGGKYGLSEYRFGDGTWYYFNGDGIYRLPKSYGTYRDDMRVLYIDKLLEATKLFSPGDNVTFTTTYGDEEFSTVKLTVDSSVLKLLFGMPSYGMYESASLDTTSKDVKKYADWVAEDNGRMHTYADNATVVVLIDKENRLRGISVEAKGGGMTTYFTSVVVALDNQNVRSEPDISASDSFMASLFGPAVAVADAKSYEEALGIINEMNSAAAENANALNDSGGD